MFPRYYIFLVWIRCCAAKPSIPTGCSGYGAIDIKTGFCHNIEENGFRYYGMLYNKCMHAIESLGLKLLDKRIEKMYSQDTTPGCFYDSQKQRGFYQLRMDQNVEASTTMVAICACISKPGGTCDYDPDQDMDEDGLCADVDPCASDAENDVDNDQICGDVDPCPHDPENDVDSDSICRKKYICPVGNDADSDNVCTDVDTCPADPDNDIDSDQLCRNVDSCPFDPENDGDSDSLCRAVDPCPNDRNNDEDSDGLCGNSDACAQDAENDADSDQVCGDLDSCLYDAKNDADSDRICGDVDTCPVDPENDEDSDRLCSNEESCGSKFIRITDGTCNSNGYRNVFPGQCTFAASMLAQRCTGSTNLISDLGQPTGCFHPSETTPIYNVATILSNAQPFTTDRPGLCKCSRQTCSDGHVEIYTGSCESNGHRLLDSAEKCLATARANGFESVHRVLPLSYSVWPRGCLYTYTLSNTGEMQEALYFNTIRADGSISAPLQSKWVVSFCACDEFVSMPFPSIPHKHALRFHIRFPAWGSEILIANAHTTYNASSGIFESSNGWELVYRYVVDPSISSNTWVLQHSSEKGVDFRAWITDESRLDWLSDEGTAVLQVSMLYGKSIQEVGELKWTTGDGKTSEKLVIATSTASTVITTTSLTNSATTTATNTAEKSAATTNNTSATTLSAPTLAATSTVETTAKAIMDTNASSSRDCEGVWSSWSACSSTCGAGGYQWREWVLTRKARNGGRDCAVLPKNRLAVRACASKMLCPDHFCASKPVNSSKATECVTLVAVNFRSDDCPALDTSQTQWFPALLTKLPPLIREQINPSAMTISCSGDERSKVLKITFPVEAAVDVARELQTYEPFVTRLNDMDTSFKVFERSTRSPHPLVQCLDSVTATTESSSHRATITSKSSSHSVTTTAGSAGDIGCSQSSQAAKGDGGNQNSFSSSHLIIVVVVFAVSVLVVATLVFVVATQRRLRNSTKLDLLEVTLEDNHATTYSLHMNTPGGSSPFQTPHDAYGSPPSQPSAHRVSVSSPSLPAKKPEVMQSMPSDIRNEDERLIMARSLSLSHKQQSSTQSSNPVENMNNVLSKTLPDDGSYNKTASPTQQLSLGATEKPNPRAGMRMSLTKPNTPRKTYRISILDSDMDDFDDFTINGDSQHFVDDVLEGIIDSARPSAALSPTGRRSPRFLDPSVAQLGGTPYLRSATTLQQ